jgi:hypothetical protein
MKITGIFLIFVFTALLAGVMLFSFSKVNAQNSTTNLQFQNTGNMTSSGEKSYVLILGQRTIGNIDNSTKIVSSIVGHSIVKINEEFLEEISLAPNQQLENQVNKIIQDGLGGSSCGGDSLITQEGKKFLLIAFHLKMLSYGIFILNELAHLLEQC